MTMITRKQQRRRTMLFVLTTGLLLQGARVHAFMVRTPPSPAIQSAPSPRTYAMARLVTSRLSTRLLASATSPDKMKAGEIRKELESYGISTKAFLEKKELVAALEEARAEGKKPIKEKETTKEKTATDANGEEQPSSGASRKERIDAEKKKAKAMKVGELKKALQEMGISTKSFFEKTEFVQAYAEAMVDGKKKRRTSAGAPPPREEKYDPSYRDVVMQKFDPRLLGRGNVIDVTP